MNCSKHDTKLVLTQCLSMQNAVVAEEFDMPWTQDFVEKLSAFDRRMNQAVIDSGILKGIPHDALAREGDPMRHHPAHPLEPFAVQLTI